MASSSTVEAVGNGSRAGDPPEGRGVDARPTVASSPKGCEELPSDVVFGLLSAERRRHVLRYLNGTDGGTTIGEVAEHVGAMENGVEVGRLSSTQRKRAYVGLYQNHLPKLDDANVVDYDRARGTVELEECADQLFPHLYLDSAASDGRGARDGLPATEWLIGLAATLRSLVPF